MPKRKPADPTAAAVGRGLAPEFRSGVMVGMRAAGISHRQIAEVMELARGSVSYALNRIPNAREFIDVYRERLKVLKIYRAHAIEEKLWDRLDKEVECGAAKDVDAIARALHSSERIQGLAAGEGQRGDESGQPTNPVAVADLKMIIQVLLDDSSDKERAQPAQDPGVSR